ncbi:ACP S-malonyltransferase [Aliikangiella sp. IMCC44359]|uniref:ACP S-malonyltransferase n=1 Tax=Aliikangiella sp. IMCC44359 TaxID=3459125 RepID=UPI00403B3898
MKTFVFPGQGSQAKGMGNSLFDQYQSLTDIADQVLGYSIKELCLEDPRNELGQTQFTQPAIFVVSALSYYQQLEEDGQKPDYVAGHSLGEFNALLAAECFDFKTGLSLVQKRGQLMSQASEGGMAAVINASEKQIESILADNGLDKVVIANHNSPSQMVISGDKSQVSDARKYFKEAAIRCIPLNTSGAFHSPFMQDAREEFARFLEDFEFSDPVIPVISNVTAQAYEPGKLISNLSSQITNSVLWTQTIQHLLSEAANNGQDMTFNEVGHGKVLTNLIASIEKDWRANQSKQPLVATQKVKMWNEKYPIGTAVKSSIVEQNNLKTRTEAMVLFQHRAAIYLEGFRGYFDLDELTPEV